MNWMGIETLESPNVKLSGMESILIIWISCDMIIQFLHYQVSGYQPDNNSIIQLIYRVQRLAVKWTYFWVINCLFIDEKFYFAHRSWRKHIVLPRAHGTVTITCLHTPQLRHMHRTGHIYIPLRNDVWVLSRYFLERYFHRYFTVTFVVICRYSTFVFVFVFGYLHLITASFYI